MEERKVFIATTTRQGLNIGNLRCFNNVVDAVVYVKAIDNNLFFARVYEVFSDKGPRLIRQKQILEILNANQKHS
jgi:hypothetical protein